MHDRTKRKESKRPDKGVLKHTGPSCQALENIPRCAFAKGNEPTSERRY